MSANIDVATLKKHTPFNELGDGHISDALRAGDLIELTEGKMLFKREDSDEFNYWLLEGSLDLLDANFDVTQVSAGDHEAQGPIDAVSPHQVTAVSTSESKVFRIKKAVMELMVSLDEAGDYMVSNVSEVHEAESDWMSSMLSSPLFDFVPPANIQELFSKFEEVQYKNGEVVLKQGEQGDYFYAIQTGRANVEHDAGGKLVKLAELGPGSFFGEDALVSEVPRNATITMLSDGNLMRLSKPDFESLLQAPLLEKLSMDEVKDMVSTGDPKTYILDVRSSREFQEGKLEGSINLPLMSLRKNLQKLKEDAVYVTRSIGDKRGELAAYILNGNGFTAYVLKDGDE